MKINTKQILVQLNGEPFKNGDKELTVGEVISTVLSLAKDGGKMKMYDLALKFYKQEEVELDNADAGLVEKAMEASGYNNIVIGHILTIISDAKAKK